ncbi:MAG: hypothetical protein GY696_13245 [Gammaproteobacteria bacterium]|nr:hypothetical protein [Gammaproteobacteria bacterium]
MVVRRSRAYKKAMIRERSLFVLMICVAILAFIHVAPREIKRILELLYPNDKMMQNTLNRSLPLDYRLACFRMFLYGDKLLTVFCNLCTTIDRGLLFYLYFALNPIFRTAVLRLLSRTFCFHRKTRCFFYGVYNSSRRRRRSYDSIAPDDRTSFSSRRSSGANLSALIVPGAQTSNVSSQKSSQVNLSVSVARDNQTSVVSSRKTSEVNRSVSVRHSDTGSSHRLSRCGSEGSKLRPLKPGQKDFNASSLQYLTVPNS